MEEDKKVVDQVDSLATVFKELGKFIEENKEEISDIIIMIDSLLPKKEE